VDTSRKTAETAGNGELPENAGLRSAAEGAIGTGRALEAAQQRDARGRFVRGAKAGPGRPTKSEAAGAAGELPAVDGLDAPDLLMTAAALRDSQQMWLDLLATCEGWIVDELAYRWLRAGRYVPARVWEELGPERTAAVEQRAAERRSRSSRRE
jgi:hypothetical protein